MNRETEHALSAERLAAVFDDAAELDVSARPAYLDRACGDDRYLRREVETLLAALDNAGDVRRILARLPLAALPDPRADAKRERHELSGHRIGHYQIVKKIGSGGMGVVYLARDTKLERLVALKFLPPYLSADAEAKARLIHEAKAASALDHPNICTVFDIDETEEGQLFIAMAYYEGETLEKLISRGPLPVEEALDFTLQIAQGLRNAHATGIVHRDIKPANLLVTTANAVKILDFGIAKVVGVNLTKTGTRRGTVAFMSPEQLRGEDVDQRADLWSLGVVLYHALTGRLPFQGDHDEATMLAILIAEPEPVTALRPELPLELKRIAEKALAKDRDERYQRVDELLADLVPVARAFETRSLLSAPARPPLRMRYWRSLVVGAILLAIAVFAAGQYLFRGHTVHAPAITSIVVLPLQNLSQDVDQEYFVAGMHDAMIGALAQLGSVRVISRTSAMRYRDSDRSIGEIARELDVNGIVEASVYREGSYVRIQVRLIQALPEERYLWTQAFERPLENVPAMHNDVARAIAGQIRATLSPEESSRLAGARTVNVETYEAYLRGMYHLNKSTREDFERGLAYLHEAVEKDPADPRAYTGLAVGYVTLGHGAGARADGWPIARAAVERALGLDSTLAEAWAALADIKLYHERDWSGAERAFRRANELNPNLAMNHYHYAWYLIVKGRVEEALAEHRRAQELDPLTPLHTVWLPGVYLWSGQYEKALEEARPTAERYPDHATALFVLGTSAAQVGAYDEAIAAHEKMAAVNSRWKFALGRTYALAGRTGDAESILTELEEQPPTSWGAYGLACLHTALGNTDEAFRWLMYEPAHGWIGWSGNDPMLEPLRDDPRFKIVMRRMNLPT